MGRIQRKYDISTHSLTRRLTVVWNQWIDINAISTHSLTRRLTANAQAWYEYFKNFNSQPHKEADNPAPHGYGTDVVFQLTASQGG